MSYAYKNQTHFASAANDAVALAAESYAEWAENFMGEKDRLPNQFNISRLVDQSGNEKGFNAEFCDTAGHWFECALFLSNDDAHKVYKERTVDMSYITDELDEHKEEAS